MPLLVCRSFLVFFVGLVVVARVSKSLKLHTITGNIKLEDVRGRVAVFADFNSDKATDILFLNTTGIKLAKFSMVASS